MVVCLEHTIGSIVAADEPVDQEKFIKCDGRLIHREEYPDLFEHYGTRNNSIKLPDCSKLTEYLNGIVTYYLKVS